MTGRWRSGCHGRASHERPSSRAGLGGAALALAGVLLSGAPAGAQYQPSLPSVARQPAGKPCCEPYDARGAARDLSLQQQRLRQTQPLSDVPRVDNLAPDRTPQRRAPAMTRPGQALEGTGSDGPGTVYDGPSRELFRPVEPPTPLD